MLGTFFLSLGSITSEFPAKFGSGVQWFGSKFPSPNKIYSTVDFLPEKQSFLGNIFREQGLVTFLLLTISLILITINLRSLRTYQYKKIFTIILVAITLTGFVNSVEALRQTSVYIIENPERLSEGKWIFGYFGQTNFFVGNQILSLLCGMQLFTMIDHSKLNKQDKIHNSYEIALKTILLVVIFMTVSSLIPTLSIWGWGLASLAIILFFLMNLFKKTKQKVKYVKSTHEKTLKLKYFEKSVNFLRDNLNEDVFAWVKESLNYLYNFSTKRFLINSYRRFKNISYVNFLFIVLTLSVLTILPFLIFISEYLPEQQHRINIWEGIFNSYIVKPIGENDWTTFLFGTGFDNLGEKLQDDRYLTDHYIDRAHNLPLDVLSASGIVGLSIFCFLIYSTYKLLFKKHDDVINERILDFLAVALTVLLIRSFIHTNSIINLMHIGFIFAFIWSYDNSKKLN